MPLILWRDPRTHSAVGHGQLFPRGWSRLQVTSRRDQRIGCPPQHPTASFP
jgi:hypothetical protein